MLTSDIISALNSLRKSRSNDALLGLILANAAQQLQELQSSVAQLRTENKNLKDILRNMAIKQKGI